MPIQATIIPGCQTLLYVMDCYYEHSIGQLDTPKWSTLSSNYHLETKCFKGTCFDEA